MTLKITLWRFVSFLLFIFMVATPLSAQQQDFQTRFGLSVDGEIWDNTSLSLVTEQRWKLNSSINDRTIVQPAIGYDLNKLLSFKIGYRLAWVYDYKRSTELKHRIHADVNLKHSIDRFRFRYRSKIQYGYEDYRTINYVGENALVHRAKAEIRYTPYGFPVIPTIYYENFQELNHERGVLMNRNRYGVSGRFNYKTYSLDLFYQIDQEINESNPLTEYILGLQLGYRF